MRSRFSRRAGIAVLAVAALVAPAAQAIAPRPLAEIDPALAAAMAETPTKVGVIAHFASPPTEADVEAMRAAGFLPGMIRYSVVDAVFGEGPVSAVEALARNPRVTLLEHDAVIPWSLDRATTAGRAEPVWDATYQSGGTTETGGITGKGVGIAIVDSGVDARHPDLLWKPLADATSKQAKTIANFKLLGRDSFEITETFVEGVEAVGVDTVNTDNTGGHGTHVAGIAAGSGEGDARFKGAAPGADLIGYGAGETLLIHLGLAAFDHIHQNHDELGIRVVNNSWGGAGDWEPDYAVTKAARRLVNEDGLVVVFAAGNSGGDGSDIQTSVWGNIPEVIQVGNYYDRTGWLDDTSSRGLKAEESTWPDLSAPGTQIVSAAAAGGPVTYYGTTQDALISNAYGYGEPVVVSAPTGGAIDAQAGDQQVIVGDYASFTGTSMAAPFVAGVAALVLEANPALGPFEVREVLRRTATMPSGRTYANDGFAIGHGVVDAAEAVAVALRMADGASLEDAISTASLDLTAEPAQINLGTGPVTDQTIPLAPGGEVQPITGNPQMFHASAIDPAVLTGVYGFAPGELVGLSVRQVQSSDPDVGPIDANNAIGTFEIHRGGRLVYGPFNAEVATTKAVDGSSFGVTYSYDWTIPVDAAPGSYEFVSTTTLRNTGGTYPTAVLDFFVGAPE